MQRNILSTPGKKFLRDISLIVFITTKVFLQYFVKYYKNALPYTKAEN